MSTVESKTRSSFERLVRQKGALVHWHREIGGDICPCITPEGFRNPEWHRQNPTRRVCNDDGRLVYDEIIIPPGWTTNSSLNAVIDQWFTTWDPGDTLNSPLSESVALIFSYDLIFNTNNHIWEMSGAGKTETYFGAPGHDQDPASAIALAVDSQAPVPPGTFQVVSDSVMSGRRVIIVASKSGLLVDYNSFDPNFPDQYVWTSPTDDLNSLWAVPQPTTIHHGILEDRDIKGFVQPAFISTRSRSNQLLMESFGEIQADDHIGIFPIMYNNFEIDFSDWSNSGTDWIEFNGMRFIAVAWNQLPAPDNTSVNHHWEIALRRVNEDEPNG